MVSISLRAYVNEINDMVDQHQIDEAIAHCRHILKEHPKHVDTYRLLGKAYLEEQRYGDAADILQRVLSSVPEDFISQVGMSIIREDEGNLDSAIYHMERAFETQPSNHAIQGELRRLNSKRDGIELTRVRLTRGALARMYAHGHLYDQAISELLAALSEDPNRFDLQNLLAEMYYKTDKKVDAAETCTKILEKLPYCINANKLLTQILEESGRPEEAQRYRKRWAALDPYAHYVGKEFTLIDTVPDNRVTINHLDYDPSGLYEESGQPAWASSLGLSMDDSDSAEKLPDWLGKSADPDDAFGNIRPTEMLSSSDSDPLFGDGSTITDGKRIGLMPQGDDDQADDWLSRLDQPDEGEQPLKAEPSPFSFDEDQEEDTNDWLASMDTPSEEPAPAGDDLFSNDSQEEDADDWLSSLETSDEESAPAGGDLFPDESQEEDADDWLSSLETADEEPAPTGGDLFTDESQDEDADDWLSSLETTDEEPAPVGGDLFADDSQDEDADDWLSSLETSDEEPAPADDNLFGDDSQEEDSDAWLASLEEKAADTLPTREEAPASDPSSELPDFLKDAGWEQGTGEVDESAPLNLDSEEELAQGEIPDWIQGMAPVEDQSGEMDEDPNAEADPEWMKSLNAPASSPVDWMSDLEQGEEESQSEPGAEPVTPGQTLEADEMDMAWLENLAAKQGIPDDEMTTSAEQRAEVTEADAPAVELSEELELPETLMKQSAPEKPTGDTDWLKQIGLSDSEEQKDQADDEVGDSTAAWLDAVQAEDSAKPDTGSDDTVARFLAAKQGLGDQPPTGAQEDEGSEEDWLAEAIQQPDEPAIDEEDDKINTDWLKAIGQEAAAEAAETSEDEPSGFSPVDEEEDDLDMDWLSQIGDEAAAEAAEEPLSATPDEETGDDDWLAKFDAPIEEEAPVSPVDEEGDDLDMDWLSQIGDEAAAEAAEEPLPEFPVEEAGDDDWLAKFDAPIEEEAPVSPVDEEGDDLDMDWLSQIGDEAAAEAAEEPLAESPEEDTEDADWLTELDSPVEEETPVSPVDEEEDDLDMDWLSQTDEEAADEAAGEIYAPSTIKLDDWDTETDTPKEEAPGSPVDEEKDSFDTSWLSQISEEAAADAAKGQPEELNAEIPTEETEDDEWLASLASEEEEAPASFVETPAAPVDEEEDDFDMDWLEEISEEALQEAAGEEASEAVSPVDVDEDDFDMDWLDEISEEAAAEAATEAVEEPVADETFVAADEPFSFEDETPVEEDIPILPVDEEEDDFDEDWLDAIGEEAAQEAAEPVEEEEEFLFDEPAPVEDFSTEEEPEEDDWLAKLEAEDELEHAETISDTDAWLLSMGEDASPPQEEQIEPVADSDEWLSTLGIQEDEDQLEEPEATPPIEIEPELDLEPPAVAGEPIQPTHAEEWKPESAVQPETTAPETKPDPLFIQLSAARQAMQQ
ncbi:MAG: tetratricopeptide repeat protein, partial [Anaerolineales bacterium]